MSTSLKIGLIIAFLLSTGAVIWRINHAFNEAAKVDGLEQQIRILKVQHQADKDQCEADKVLTEKVETDYENKLSDLSDQLADIKRLRPNKCVFPTAGQASQFNAAADNGKPAAENGLETDWLYDFAGTCEGFRLQIIGLQEFINRLYESRGIK